MGNCGYNLTYRITRNYSSGWWFEIFDLFISRFVGRWSNLTCAYFSNGLVQPPITHRNTVSNPKRSHQLVRFDKTLINFNRSDETFSQKFGSVFEASQDDSLAKQKKNTFAGMVLWDSLGVAITLLWVNNPFIFLWRHPIILHYSLCLPVFLAGPNK